MYSDDYYTKLSQLCSYKLRKICCLPPKPVRLCSLRPFSALQREFRAPLNAKKGNVIGSPIRCVNGKQHQRHDQMKGLNYLRMY